MTPDLDLLARLVDTAARFRADFEKRWARVSVAMLPPKGLDERAAVHHAEAKRDAALRENAPALLAAARVGMLALDHDNGRVRDPRFIGAIEALRSHAPGGAS